MAKQIILIILSKWQKSNSAKDYALNTTIDTPSCSSHTDDDDTNNRIDNDNDDDAAFTFDFFPSKVYYTGIPSQYVTRCTNSYSR